MDNALEVVSQDGGTLYFLSDKVHGLPPDGLSNTQADIFSDVQDMMLDTLEGLNGCIMAYGQTGSGKTFTLAGNLDSSPDQGILTRSVNHLSKAIREGSDGNQIQVHLSMVEIFCESIRDLLSDGPGSTSWCPAVQRGKELGTIIARATEVAVTDYSELVELTQQALARRTMAPTSTNAASSRSHCLITFTVQRLLPDGSVMRGKLSLVDLAGSEHHENTLADVERGVPVDASLCVLGNVVKAVAK
ncbi:g10982 [Coccomyxa viridis]|uniref:G10982 protein n=1 Tax=Coccomyxa viridis TaxID=1274662 RepID=A0ABP1G9C3_9CHLO